MRIMSSILSQDHPESVKGSIIVRIARDQCSQSISRIQRIQALLNNQMSQRIKSEGKVLPLV